MYLVQDGIIERLLQDMPKEYLTIKARLTPSMRVVNLEDITETIRVKANMEARRMVAKANGTTLNTNEIEEYRIDMSNNPLMLLEKEGIVIYYSYILQKEN